MATETTTEVVLIDFQTDFTQLESATDVLARTGQIDKKLADQFKRTNTEIQNQQKAINNTAKAMQDASKKEVISIEQVRAEIEAFVNDFIQGFQEGVIEELKNAGIEFDEFGKVVINNTEKITKESSGLKQELAGITKRMQELKLAGNETSDEFVTLANRAGQIRDAMGDVSKEINRFASDTKTIDGLIDAATGVAGAFSVAQGVAGAFGDAGEDLQEVLLKVNSALAILQGLQQVGNLLTKDSAAVTTINTIAQQGYNLAIGQSIGLLKAFRIALALTGIGAVIIGITFLVQWLNRSSDAIEANTKALQKLNDEFERDAKNLDESVDNIKRATAERVAALQTQGATEKQLRAETLNGLKEELQGVFELQQGYREQRDAAEQVLIDVARGNRKFNKEEVEAAEAVVQKFDEFTKRRKDLSTELRVKTQEDLQQTKKEELQSIADSLEARLSAARKNSSEELALNKQLARARAAVELNEAGQNLQQRLLIEANLQKQLRQLDLEFAKVRQQDRISALQVQLIAEQGAREQISIRTTQQEIDLQKRIIQESARLELLEEGLTANQKLAIQKKALADQAALQRDFDQQTTQQTLEDFISRNNKELANVKLTSKEKLALNEENLIAQAAIEIEANKGAADKIKEIEAKRDADIKALRLQNIQETLNRELELEAARTGALRRGQERVLSSERSTLKQRIAAINQLAVLDIAAINAKQDALEKELQQGLISQEDYLVEYEKLKDEELAVTERTELAKRDITRKTNEELFALAIQISGQIADIAQQAGEQRLEAQQAQIDQARQQIDALLEAGAITEKEAERRRKQQDIEERRLRRLQAQREKDFAVFKALLAIPQAYLTGLAQGGPILAAIYAGLAAAQAIVIATKQPPKFGGGKKDKYEGPAEIGETGGELWQTDNGIYYVPKRTFVWMGKDDKVFNPQETTRMLEKQTLQIENIKPTEKVAFNSFNIDYEKLGKAVGKNIPQIGFDFNEHGFMQWQKGQTSFDKYLDKRRSYGL